MKYDNIKILGFLDNPYPYIKNSVATVLTSLSEGFSLALAESVLLDTPIISTNVGIADELVKKYDCGTIINYDERELADVILEYLKKYDENIEKKHFFIGNEFDIRNFIICNYLNDFLYENNMNEKLIGIIS